MQAYSTITQSYSVCAAVNFRGACSLYSVRVKLFPIRYYYPYQFIHKRDTERQTETGTHLQSRAATRLFRSLRRYSLLLHARTRALHSFTNATPRDRPTPTITRSTRLFFSLCRLSLLLQCAYTRSPSLSTHPASHPSTVLGSTRYPTRDEHGQVGRVSGGAPSLRCLLLLV